jgi:glycosyltransferase involved in cell wall biosynthesis
VILATRNRAELVPRAVESVVAQTYRSWELIAVDDGSEDDTEARLRRFADPRILVMRSEHRGLAGARNRGLAEASGEYVAYIDDDNTMHPEWLRAVVWAFETWPDTDLLYGATLVDDDVTREAAAPHGLPWVRFVPYERAEAMRQNPTDIGSMAHRRKLPDATFDEDLRALEDWDLLLRVGGQHVVRALPAVASIYSTSAADRLTDSPEWDDAWTRMRAKHDLLDKGST